ncbi:aldehyde dehydrogenase family protein [Nocardioides dongkuii]|uniref:aldehyde dehydrogenase family protein n=1 Tax=Nocardioides dongkuii TaxID=2760089 RepID=UPI0015F7A206|nr:aldehyde dehydrogenase family protein [Nocardioides dongkuii]
MSHHLSLDPASRPRPRFLDGAPKQLFIGGEWRPAGSGQTLTTIDPMTEQVITSIASADAADVDLAVAAARRAFESDEWSAITPYQRGLYLSQIADVIEANADELATLDSLDMGGPFALTRWMVGNAIETYRHYAGWPTKIYGQTAPSAPGQFNYVVRQPLGVTVAITPWNGPFLQMSWKVAPALATGNTVVAKPAQQTSLSALRFAELLAQTDLPRGVFNIITGEGGVAGEALIQHPDVNKVSFTGSTAVGKHLLAASAVNVKRLTLELGGKSPTIVFADADLPAAAKAAAGDFLNGSGQSCVAGTRIFVEEPVREEFSALLAEEMATYVTGDPFHPDTVIGPLASRAHYDRVVSYFDVARDAGATITTGGVEDPDGGLFVAPTLVENVTNDARIAQEEVFGPVAVLIPFNGVDEVVRMSNDSIYGLASYVWTRDLSQAHTVAARLEAGSVFINSTAQMSSGILPFGGFKQSGIGREHGTDVIDAFTETKTVVVNL